MTDELRKRLYTDVTISRTDKERLEKKADEMGEDVSTILEWLIEEFLDELV